MNDIGPLSCNPGIFVLAWWSPGLLTGSWSSLNRSVQAWAAWPLLSVHFFTKLEASGQRGFLVKCSSCPSTCLPAAIVLRSGTTDVFLPVVRKLEKIRDQLWFPLAVSFTLAQRLAQSRGTDTHLQNETSRNSSSNV